MHIDEQTHRIFHKPFSEHSSAEISKDSASDATAFWGLTSAVRGITATIRGAPSTPLNIRVAEINAFRLTVCACFALFRRFRRDWAAALEVGDALAN